MSWFKNPKRRSFSEIAKKDLREEIAFKSEEIARSLKNGLPLEAAKDISESIMESAQILGTGVPNIKRFGKSGSVEGGLTHAAGLQTSIFPFIKPRIVVTDEYIEDIKNAYQSPNIRRKNEMRKHVRETFAEEMGHLYVHNNYPQVSERGVRANRIGGNDYMEDRDEKFSKKFAEGYVKCKESLES